MSKIGDFVVNVPSLSESSMSYVKKNLDSFKHGTLLTAHDHSHAKGRNGRTWEIMPGQLLLTYILKPEHSKSLEHLFMATSSAICQTINEYTPALIKWPNDIVINKKKCAGMLFDAVWAGNQLSGVVLGIGINLNNSFDPGHSLASSATSLKQEADYIDQEHFLSSLNKNLSEAYILWEKENHALIYKTWDALLAFKKNLFIAHDENGEKTTGIFVSTLADGRALIKREDGSIKTLFICR